MRGRWRPRTDARSVLPGLLRVALIGVLVGATLARPGTATATATATASLPPGFAVQELPSGQSGVLTDFASAPDGSYFTIGKNGTVAWVSADGAARTLATLPVVTQQDLGLVGLAVAPDYVTSRRIYLASTLPVGDVWTMRLAAWTVTGDPEPTGLEGEQVLWDLPAGSDAHAMTGIVAAPDGTLWVSVGDSADFRVVDPQALRALDPSTGYGKLLHVLPDGLGVPTNPFYDPAAPSSWQSRVYASGFRSPFRLSLDPATGAPILGDVGWNDWEEVDLVQPGAGYGWPCWEGNTPTPGYADLDGCQGVGTTAPLWTYPHGPAGTAVVGGVVYTGSSYPADYQGAYFFGDYSSGRVYTLRYGAHGQLERPPEPDGFVSGVGAPVAFATAPDGDVVWADISRSVLQRLVYLPGNRAPSARVAVSTDPDTREVTFDGSGSTDLDGDALTYRWDFGDGTTGDGVVAKHTYAAPGTARITAHLTVSDPQGGEGTTTVTVVPANHVPVLTLTAPPPDRRFAVGDPVEASATVDDVEDGPGSSVTWSVVLVHCSGGYCHQHPGPVTVGPTFALPFADHGDDTSLRIDATTTDSAGVSATTSFTALPQLRTFTVAANTPAAITINGVARISAQVTVGARVSVIAPSVAADGRAVFDSWDDGGARERTEVMPDQDVVRTARYVSPPGSG